METGWDGAFSGLQSPQYIRINLENGSYVCGVFGAKSIASTNLSKRDIFIEEVLGDNFEGYEIQTTKQGMWLREDQITSFVLIPME